MKDLAVKVEGLYKQYFVAKDHDGFLSTPNLDNSKDSFIGKPLYGQEAFWALQDISFEVKKGEVFGIIGANGAGKSTLLKILSGITPPTKGYAKINGCVTSLLEVGTGFHPELTGRENIFMNGSVLGMSREEIASKIDNIIAFSEIEKFIDTPVKRYSSGMQVRLAFSVAIHLNTEILIVDEVLSVGDIAFQQKSMKAIQSLLQEGATVLMVSHNIESIRNLCDRVIILQDGKVESNGNVRAQTARYLDKMHKKEKQVPSFKNWELETYPGNKGLSIKSIWIKAKGKTIESKICVDDELEMGVEFCVLEKIICLDVAFRINDMSGYLLLGVLSERNVHEEMLGSYKATCSLPSHIFNYGRYKVDIRFLKQKKQGKFFYLDNVIEFNIDLDEGRSKGDLQILPGPLNLKSEWVLSENRKIDIDKNN